ncbi:MAG TPA: tetratricopeptide repeat protein [Burkholderiaceae bacterium]|nr:tetratricopeptide repeat protein [Burkholderiaceae bacterium]
MNRFVWAGRAALLSMVLAAGAPAFGADPTLNQVYEAARAGHLDQAQRMMNEVLRDHPNSAKAHYTEAEILAKQGRAGEARSELERAEQLAPGLPFVSPTSVQELRRVIASEEARRPSIGTGVAPAIAPSTHGSTFPWGLLAVVLVVGVIVYTIIRARRNAAVAPYGAGAGAGAAGLSSGAQPGYGAPPMAPMGGGIGSGIVGGLMTGAAVGAGVVAGEALAHGLMDRHGSGQDVPASASDRPAVADDDLGGQDFGMKDDGSWDDGGGGNFGMGGGGGDDWS